MMALLTMLMPLLLSLSVPSSSSPCALVPTLSVLNGGWFFWLCVCSNESSIAKQVETETETETEKTRKKKKMMRKRKKKKTTAVKEKRVCSALQSEYR